MPFNQLRNIKNSLGCKAKEPRDGPFFEWRTICCSWSAEYNKVCSMIMLKSIPRKSTSSSIQILFGKLEQCFRRWKNSSISKNKIEKILASLLLIALLKTYPLGGPAFAVLPFSRRFLLGTTTAGSLGPDKTEKEWDNTLPKRPLGPSTPLRFHCKIETEPEAMSTQPLSYIDKSSSPFVPPWFSQ